jgi:DNA polymerase-3 subunit gamma/tau
VAQVPPPVQSRTASPAAPPAAAPRQQAPQDEYPDDFPPEDYPMDAHLDVPPAPPSQGPSGEELIVRELGATVLEEIQHGN